jgi:DNA-binding MarR family transcriptional regulator
MIVVAHHTSTFLILQLLLGIPYPVVMSSMQESAELDDHVDLVMAASRVFIGVIAESLAPLEPTLTTPQFRTVVLLATRGPLNMTSIASLLAIHPSNATRLCDRLVDAGLVRRRPSAQDRRQVELEVTPKGRRTVSGVMNRRRAALGRVLAAMPGPARRQLTSALGAFARTAGELEPDHTWAAIDGLVDVSAANPLPVEQTEVP